MRKSFPNRSLTCTNSFAGGRSPKPVKSILKLLTTSSMIVRRLMSACAGPIDLSGRGLCKAAAEIYFASWRSFPAQEWVTEKLPVERLDGLALQHIERRGLLAVGNQQRRVGFAQTVGSDCRMVERWTSLGRDDRLRS